MKHKQIEFQARLPFNIIDKKNYYLASCTVLDVHSQGDTQEKARNNLIEALSLFFLSCFERGTLDAVLKECGFKPGFFSSKITKSSLDYPQLKKKYIDVPIPLFVN